MEKLADSRRRRSKKEAEGRSHTCECGKSYLSYQALYTHKRNKHFESLSEAHPKKKRGRPRNSKAESPYDPLSLIPDSSLSSSLSDYLVLQKSVTCDHNFSEYLLEKSKIFSKKEFKITANSIINLRNCLNKYAAEIDDDFIVNTHEDYTSVKSSALVPKISNVYLFNYLPETKSEYDYETEVEFVMAYCEWLCEKDYTDLKLCLIS